MPESKDKEKRRSRWAILKERGSDSVSLPEVETDTHLLEWIDDLGYCEQGFSGPSPLTYKEIEAWAHMTGILPTGEESRFLKMLSHEYCAQYHKSADRDAPPPYLKEDFDRVTLSDRIKAVFRSHSRYRGAKDG